MRDPILRHRRLRSVTLSLSVLTGCARWGGRTVDGPPQETARRPVGAPQVAVTTEASLEAGFGSVTQADGAGNSATLGGLAGSSGSVTRTHCIQQVDIDYSQPYEVHPEVQGRVLDWAGGVTLGMIGIGVMGIAKMRSDTIFEPGDPLYEEPPDPTPGYLLGGALIAGGVAWVLYSHAALPSGPPPPVEASRRAWTESRYVESTGCGLVPADRLAR